MDILSITLNNHIFALQVSIATHTTRCILHPSCSCVSAIGYSVYTNSYRPLLGTILQKSGAMGELDLPLGMREKPTLR